MITASFYGNDVLVAFYLFFFFLSFFWDGVIKLRLAAFSAIFHTPSIHSIFQFITIIIIILIIDQCVIICSCCCYCYAWVCFYFVFRAFIFCFLSFAVVVVVPFKQLIHGNWKNEAWLEFWDIFYLLAKVYFHEA